MCLLFYLDLLVCLLCYLLLLVNVCVFGVCVYYLFSSSCNCV